MSIRMRHTRAHTGNRRSHHALSEVRLSKCGNCSAQHRRHMMCGACGQYRGKAIVDVAGALGKRLKRKEVRAGQKTGGTV